MNHLVRRVGIFTLALAALAPLARAEGLEKAVQDKIDERMKMVVALAAEPVIVAAVREHNARLTEEQAAMDQDKWKALSMLDPFVRSFTKNAAADVLKGRKDAVMTEAFISGTDGKKVAFLSKPTNWCHAGKPKHDKPLAGQTWQGTVEVDESTGAQQVQISVPVLDGDKPIGSLVVGLNLSKLKE